MLFKRVVLLPLVSAVVLLPLVSAVVLLSLVSAVVLLPLVSAVVLLPLVSAVVLLPLVSAVANLRFVHPVVTLCLTPVLPTRTVFYVNMVLSEKLPHFVKWIFLAVIFAQFVAAYLRVTVVRHTTRMCMYTDPLL